MHKGWGWGGKRSVIRRIVAQPLWSWGRRNRSTPSGVRRDVGVQPSLSKPHRAQAFAPGAQGPSQQSVSFSVPPFAAPPPPGGSVKTQTAAPATYCVDHHLSSISTRDTPSLSFSPLPFPGRQARVLPAGRPPDDTERRDWQYRPGRR